MGQYWIDKKSPGISDTSFFQIDWDEYHRSIKSTSFGMKLYFVKGLSGFSATGKYMERVHKQSNECPRCGLAEDFLHTLKCPDEDASKIWNDNIQKAIKLIQRNISPQAAFITDQYLRSWREDLPSPTNLSIPHELTELFQCQQQLGWTAFCLGRVAIEWQQCTTSVDAHNNPKRWVRALIQKLFLTIWNMWDHRNTVLHDPNGRILSREHEQVNAKIRLEYMMGSWDLLLPDQALLLKPVEYICSRSLDRKVIWLQALASARNRANQPRLPPSNLPASNNHRTSHTPTPPTLTTGLTSWLIK